MGSAGFLSIRGQGGRREREGEGIQSSLMSWR